ncbi:MAG: hypothetical protein IKM43_01260 [Clostridia bacterium]|nr:hypothetical protein [Clostridia bacterium]
MRPTQNDVIQSATKVAKRVAITILVCIPFLIVFAYLMRNIITSNGLQILCFMLFMAVAVLIEEIVARKKEKRKKAQEILSPKKDVFK